MGAIALDDASSIPPKLLFIIEGTGGSSNCINNLIIDISAAMKVLEAEVLEELPIYDCVEIFGTCNTM